MSLTISSECINCDVCEPVCPNRAISMGIRFYVIDPELCTECIGHFEEPQCMVVCPVEGCITPDPHHQESREALAVKAERLRAAQQP